MFSYKRIKILGKNFWNKFFDITYFLPSLLLYVQVFISNTNFWLFLVSWLFSPMSLTNGIWEFVSRSRIHERKKAWSEGNWRRKGRLRTLTSKTAPNQTSKGFGCRWTLEMREDEDEMNRGVATRGEMRKNSGRQMCGETKNVSISNYSEPERREPTKCY